MPEWDSAEVEAKLVKVPPDLRPAFAKSFLELQRVATELAAQTAEPKWRGAVFEATVPPHAILALIDGGRGESEVVVNPRCLRGKAKPTLVEVVESAASPPDGEETRVA